MKEVKNWFFASILGVVPTLLVWLPFYLRRPVFWSIPLPTTGMQTLVSNYDGPLYVVIAKSLYNPEVIKQFFEFPIPIEYYAAHFPLYPLLIRLFSFSQIGYLYSMLAVTVFGSILAIYFFQKFISQYISKDAALLATIFFSFFPAI